MIMKKIPMIPMITPANNNDTNKTPANRRA